MEGSGGGLAWRDSGRFRRRVSLEGKWKVQEEG